LEERNDLRKGTGRTGGKEEMKTEGKKEVGHGLDERKEK
jgi:hypothetical protein